jgi:ankyrin repeat protein
MSTTMDFFDSVRTGRLQRMRRLLDEDPALLRAVDSNGETPVLEALYYGQPGALDLLLEHADELDIFEAAALGRVGRVLELIGSDASRIDTPSADGYTPLQLACFFGRTDAVELLLERGADPSAIARNSRRATALHGAAHRGHIECARLLLDAGGNPNARDINGETPLHLAARNHDDAMQLLLLSRGANPAISNNAGDTPEESVCAPSYGESE